MASQDLAPSNCAATRSLDSSALPDVREIPLTRGFVAIVDAADFERVSAKKWTASAVRGDTARAQHYWREGPRVFAIGIGRFILDAPAGYQVDHINGDPLDNRRDNLRVCTHAQNMQNRGAFTRRKHSIPYKGVHIARSGRFFAIVKAAGVAHWCGTFETPEAAARAYDAKAVEVFGAFARLNFPEAA